jgi:hypothetical protein
MSVLPLDSWQPFKLISLVFVIDNLPHSRPNVISITIDGLLQLKKIHVSN